MSFPNPVVYIQFHPVTYMVKLNIEMSMASLIIRLARVNPSNEFSSFVHHSSAAGQIRFEAELDRMAANPLSPVCDHPNAQHESQTELFSHAANRGPVQLSSLPRTRGEEASSEGILKDGADLKRAVPTVSSSISSGPDEVERVCGSSEDRFPLTQNSAVSIPAPSKIPGHITGSYLYD
jgi:hypothetical protein